MNIRFATHEDKNQVLNLLNELGKVEDEIKGYSPDHTKAHIKGEKVYDDVIKSNNAKIIIAEESEKILGVITFFLIPYIRYGNQRGYVIDFVVSKQARGKGIGTKLLNAVKEYAKKNNIQKIKIDTGLTQAKKFYANNEGKIVTDIFTFTLDE